MNDLVHSTAFDALNPNLETSFGKSSRIDRRRPESAITGWQTTMKQYEDWLSRQEDAQFIRKLPMGMIADHGDHSFTNRTAGIIMPEKCTGTWLVNNCDLYKNHFQKINWYSCNRVDGKSRNILASGPKTG